jgi:hypothetical protein
MRSVAWERLAELRLGMPAYYIDAIPEDETSRRKLFEFARELGVETIVTSSVAASLAVWIRWPAASRSLSR